MSDFVVKRTKKSSASEFTKITRKIKRIPKVKNAKGLLAFAFLGGIMITSGVVIAIPGIIPGSDSNAVSGNFTMTGTPADNFPDESRAQMCGPGTSKSNAYVTEYAIPTPCTQPLAITSDFFGNIWFGETNTGNVVKFDPLTQNFSEYPNPSWPANTRSMFWGMDYASDNSIWYTDELNDSLWRFSIDDQKYQRLSFPTAGESLPQRLLIDGSQIIVNDFTGNKLTLLDTSSYSENTEYLNILPPIRPAITGDFTLDNKSNIWHTNWIPNERGVLVKFEYEKYRQALTQSPDLDIRQYRDVFQLPPQIQAVNGLVMDKSNVFWLADTDTSYFYNFNPNNTSYVQYVTSNVPQSAYGNHTGVVKSDPLSRPYWMEYALGGQIIFNEQAANRIAVFDPRTETLVEYTIPTQNPNWSDCDDVTQCGLAQVFDFTIVDDKIWFTEWAANNIGVVDTSIMPPIDVSLDSSLAIYDNNSTATLIINANSDVTVELVSNSVLGDDISLLPDTKQISLLAGDLTQVPFKITVSDNVRQGTYKVLVGAQTPDIVVSQFLTLIVT